MFCARNLVDRIHAIKSQPVAIERRESPGMTGAMTDPDPRCTGGPSLGRDPYNSKKRGHLKWESLVEKTSEPIIKYIKYYPGTGCKLGWQAGKSPILSMHRIKWLFFLSILMLVFGDVRLLSKDVKILWVDPYLQLATAMASRSVFCCSGKGGSLAVRSTLRGGLILATNMCAIESLLTVRGTILATNM